MVVVIHFLSLSLLPPPHLLFIRLLPRTMATEKRTLIWIGKESVYTVIFNGCLKRRISRPDITTPTVDCWRRTRQNWIRLTGKSIRYTRAQDEKTPYPPTWGMAKTHRLTTPQKSWNRLFFPSAFWLSRVLWLWLLCSKVSKTRKKPIPYRQHTRHVRSRDWSSWKTATDLPQ